jgi:diguanylate cyclase (GGDEF)-like protein
MDRKARLLLIGPRAQRDALASALPDCEVQVAQHALEGLWQSGRQRFDHAFVSLSVGSKALRAVSSLRQVTPEMRIVVGCEPADEPIARRALDQGADDYVLEPVRREDLEQAFGVSRPRPLPAPVTEDTPGPTFEELTRLSEVLQNLGEGALATLDRLATLVQQGFDAQGVVIEFEDLACTVGDVEELVLEEIIRRHDRPVGRVGLARRTRGAYAANAAVRLGEYARLVEATIAQARDRARWRDLAWTDDLSTLHNRRYFEQTLDQLIERATAERLRLTVLLFDIDDFKSYNDRFGHDVGDRLIQEVALLLRRCTRERDVVVRYGGDEFAVVFWDAEKQRVPGSEHPQEPIELATRFCKAIADHNFQCLGSDAPGPVTISGGLACFPWNGHSRAQLMSAADEALLTAKRTGKNQIHLAGPTDEEPASPTAKPAE